MNTQADTRPNLYLVGFMGTGKSAVGRSVAESLGLRYLDSDHAIEQKAGRTISAIFADEGEPHFRTLERQFVETGHPSHGCVVSCGGGLILQPGILEILKTKGVIVVLTASAETIYERTKNNPNRPLLQVENPLTRIRELLGQRLPIYQRAGIEVMTDNRKLKEVASHVERVYRREAH